MIAEHHERLLVEHVRHLRVRDDLGLVHRLQSVGLLRGRVVDELDAAEGAGAEGRLDLQFRELDGRRRGRGRRVVELVVSLFRRPLHDLRERPEGGREVLALEDEAFHVRHGDDGRRAHVVVEQRHLAEVVARLHLGDRARRPGRRDLDARGAVLDDEELLALVALLDDLLAALVGLLLEELRGLLLLLRRHLGKDFDGGEHAHGQVVVEDLAQGPEHAHEGLAVQRQ
mmetsp:Transcript_14546/g.47541  ORF Transcript_14546/g.47541 Transcript_14546/m.47541 type:complete len:228 (+) Transcript_14546:133-816(+)